MTITNFKIGKNVSLGREYYIFNYLSTNKMCVIKYTVLILGPQIAEHSPSL